MARVESKTYISTEEKYDTVPHVQDGVRGILGQWMSPQDLDAAIQDRFPGCMKGKNIILFSRRTKHTRAAILRSC